MKVVFFGSSSYTISLLKQLHHEQNLALIITRPDKPMGRKGTLTPSPQKIFAKENKIPVITAKNRDELALYKDKIKSLSPDLGLVADYSVIIPRKIFEIPKYKTLNIHFSCLPKLRGPSPVQYTILMGKKNTCITLHLINEGIDEGDIIWQKLVSLTGEENTPELYNKLFNIALSELFNVISNYRNNILKLKKQNHTKATYTRQITKKDGYIPAVLLALALKGHKPKTQEIQEWPLYKDLFDPITNRQLPIANLIEQASRAFTPWPGLFTHLTIYSDRGKLLNVKVAKKRLKLLECHIESATDNTGQTKKLVLDKVQLEGKKPVTWKQLREGYPKFKLV